VVGGQGYDVTWQPDWEPIASPYQGCGIDHDRVSSRSGHVVASGCRLAAIPLALAGERRGNWTGNLGALVDRRYYPSSRPVEEALLELALEEEKFPGWDDPAELPVMLDVAVQQNAELAEENRRLHKGMASSGLGLVSYDRHRFDGVAGWLWDVETKDSRVAVRLRLEDALALGLDPSVAYEVRGFVHDVVT
jgi:hypothetical protein